MSGELSLQEVFEGVEPAEEAEVEDTTGESEAETQEAAETAEDNAEAEAEAEDSTPESEDEEQENAVPVAALKAERTKRQEAQKRLDELERKLEALERPTQGKEEQSEPEPYPDVFADQEGFVKRLQQETEAKIGQVRIETAQQLMRQMHEDYDDREAKFLQYANENPAVLSDPKFKENPALFAYQFAGKLDEYSQVQNLDSYKERLKADIRKEIEAEMQKEQQTREETDDSRSRAEMPSLASSGSSGGNTVAEPSLSELTRLG